MKASRGTSHRAILLGLCGGVAVANGCISHPDDSASSGAAARASSGPTVGTPAGGSSSGSNFVIGDDVAEPPENFDAGPGCGAQTTPPVFGTPVTCPSSPPPISGGTLLVTRDGTKAIAADPDHDAVYVVDLGSKTLTFTIHLQAGDEPGRLAEDGRGRIHVALRGSGALATIDPTTGAVTARRSACPAPRGVAWQASNDTVWVACETGELASLPASGGAATVQKVVRDLRDVILTGDSLAVTQFRSANVLRLNADATIARTDALSAPMGGFDSHVAWRAVAGPSGSIVAVHQAESLQSISTKATGGYGCGGGGFPGLPVPFGDGGFAGVLALPALGNSTVESVVTTVGSDGTVIGNQIFQGVLPVDVAVSPDGTGIAAVAAGSGQGLAAIGNLFLMSPSGGLTTAPLNVGAGPAIAVVYAGNAEVLVQTRAPSTLWFVSTPSNSSQLPDASSTDLSDGGPVGTVAPGATPVTLSTENCDDVGHDIFHMHAGALLACASCHPEGGDDGHVWVLDGNQRRTPSLRGTIEGTAPYHWPGDEANFTSIVNDVYLVRMSGGMLSGPQVDALSSWINAIPAPPSASWVDPSAAAAGRAIFQRNDVGCATCHSGPKFTNNATLDVGTGGAFQVPPLVGVGWRTPLMHDGCATTIADRFGACATAAHGNISSLSGTDIANLTAYLETL